MAVLFEFMRREMVNLDQLLKLRSCVQGEALGLVEILIQNTTDNLESIAILIGVMDD